jgi:antitoxin MazE
MEMKTSIIRIGNSQGIRIPKLLLEQSRLEKEVELEVSDKQITIRSAGRPRHGWEDKFKIMTQNKDDKLIDSVAHIQNRWEKDEWEW